MKHNQRGFSLAELMMAFFLLTISGLAIFALITYGIGQYRKLSVVTNVSSLAEQKMETLMSMDVASVTSDSGTFAAPFLDYSYDVVVRHRGGGGKDVALTVRGPEQVTRRLKALRAPQELPLGMALYLKYDCWTCHANTAVPLAFQGATGVGPSLTDPGIGWTAQRRLDDNPALETAVYNFTGGTRPEDYMTFSIRQPGDYFVAGYDPGYTGGVEMPEFTSEVIPDGELEALVGWLATLNTPGVTP